MEKLKLSAIKTKSKIYISGNAKSTSTYEGSKIQGYLFDGKVPESTYLTTWVQIDKWPDKVEKIIRGGHTNYRWELKPGYPVSDLTPKIMTNEPDEDITGLYMNKYDTLPDTTEEVEIEWDVLGDFPDFEIIKPKYPSTNPIIYKMVFPSVLHTELPTIIGGYELYRIIREYIKQNINNKYARVSSDYDFSFTIMKSISYAKPIPYSKNIGTAKRPKYQTGLTTTKSIQVFNMGDGKGGSYGPLPTPISGKTYKEAEEKLDEYLKDLIEMINEPLKECSCCDGRGFILEETGNSK